MDDRVRVADREKEERKRRKSPLAFPSQLGHVHTYTASTNELLASNDRSLMLVRARWLWTQKQPYAKISIQSAEWLKRKTFTLQKLFDLLSSRA